MRNVTRADILPLLDASRGELDALSGLAARVGIVVPDEDPTLAQWERALLAIRGAGLGGRIEADVDCPSCRAKVALTFDLADVPLEAPEPNRIGARALRPLRRSDIEAIGALPDAESRLTRLLARAAETDDDWARAQLSGEERAAALEAVESAVAGLDVTLATQCAECGTEITAPFDVAAFVHGEFRARAERILDEVHAIASAYHWSEDAILSLPPHRYRGYLQRISGDAARAALFHGGW